MNNAGYFRSSNSLSSDANTAALSSVNALFDSNLPFGLGKIFGNAFFSNAVSTPTNLTTHYGQSGGMVGQAIGGTPEGVPASWREPTMLAKGGIVGKPTNTIIGEAGPEAVIPLNKPLPVNIVGGKALGSSAPIINVSVNVASDGKANVNVDQSGGGKDTSQMKDFGDKLGDMIAGAVRQELLDQQRYGGMLNNYTR
jgi:phage-related minor tail protein